MIKNRSIEFFRFFFTLVICIFHFKLTEDEIINHGYLAVELFFVLSGVWICKESIAKESLGVLQYTCKRFKRLFVPSFLVLMIFYIKHIICSIIDNTISYDYILTKILEFLSDSCFLSSIGIYGGGVNIQMWYISVLLWGGAILYAFLKINKQFITNLLIPLICIIIYGYIFRGGSGNNIVVWTNNDCYCESFLRGLADMGVGIIMYKIYLNTYERINIRTLLFINIISIISLILMICLLFTQKGHDQYSFVFSAILIYSCLVDKSWFNKMFNNKIWIKLGSITYPMFVVHGLVVSVFSVIYNNHMTFSPLWLLPIYTNCYNDRMDIKYNFKKDRNKIVEVDIK